MTLLLPVMTGSRKSSTTAYIGEVDLHFDADRLLFTMPNGRTWQIHEIAIETLKRERDELLVREPAFEVPELDAPQRQQLERRLAGQESR